MDGQSYIQQFEASELLIDIRQLSGFDSIMNVLAEDSFLQDMREKVQLARQYYASIENIKIS